jgi:hypothetical protein
MNTYRYRVAHLLAIAAVLAAITGCAGTQADDPTRQYLDEVTGITVTAVEEPAIFYHDAPRLAVHARDYLYVRPVEMNRMGKLSYYLWLAEWSTIDRLPGKDTGEKVFTGAVVFLDGVPMELQDGMQASQRYGVPEKPYSMPVETGRTVYMRVSRAQLTKISGADTVAVSLSDSAGKTRSYKLWSGTTSTFGSINKNKMGLNDRRVVQMSD